MRETVFIITYTHHVSSKTTAILEKVIQKLISGEKVDIEQSGLSKREWNELMLALELKDKLI